MNACLLIAGCGFVGEALAREALGLGVETWAVRRNVDRLPQDLVDQGLRGVSADLSAELPTSKLPSQLSHVVYAASADERTHAAYHSAYVDGLRNVLALPQLQSPDFQRLIFVSSTAVYHQNDGSWVDEESPTSPTTFTGQLLLQAEQQLQSLGDKGTVLRCSGIYGPGRRRLIKSVQSGKASYDPERPHYTNRIHRDDVAGICLWLTQQLRAPSRLLGSDPCPAAQQEVYTWLARELQVPLPSARSESGPQGATGKRCNSERIRQQGYRFKYASFKAGYGEMLGPPPHAG